MSFLVDITVEEYLTLPYIPIQTTKNLPTHPPTQLTPHSQLSENLQEKFNMRFLGFLDVFLGFFSGMRFKVGFFCLWFVV